MLTESESLPDLPAVADALDIRDLDRVAAGVRVAKARVSDCLRRLIDADDALQRDNREWLELLLAHDADPNVRDRNGDTPLHQAALRGHKKVVELLISQGADVHAQDGRGRTPLDEATRRGHTEIIQLLAARMKDRGTGNQEPTE